MGGETLLEHSGRQISRPWGDRGDATPGILGYQPSQYYVCLLTRACHTATLQNGRTRGATVVTVERGRAGNADPPLAPRAVVADRRTALIHPRPRGAPPFCPFWW